MDLNTWGHCGPSGVDGREEEWRKWAGSGEGGEGGRRAPLNEPEMTASRVYKQEMHVNQRCRYRLFLSFFLSLTHMTWG
jgi:hypothetical protein